MGRRPHTLGIWGSLREALGAPPLTGLRGCGLHDAPFRRYSRQRIGGLLLKALQGWAAGPHLVAVLAIGLGVAHLLTVKLAMGLHEASLSLAGFMEGCYRSSISFPVLGSTLHAPEQEPNTA